MSTSPTSRSRASLYPRNSQYQWSSPLESQLPSMSHHSDITLDTLVAHLLASKRSLSCISSVWRANEIVTSAREALEESVVLSARTSFSRQSVEKLLNILRKVRVGIGDVYDAGQRDFKTNSEESVIKTLDVANTRLESTMDTLRSTMVEAVFRPDNEDPRSLLDFVDEEGVETMRNSLKEYIREAKEAQTEFESSILSFDDDIGVLKAALKTPSASQPINPLSSSPIPLHLSTLETHAQEMASLLESLVRHFDLCVAAIRNTEGGYAAVKKAASSQSPNAEAVSVSGVMTEDATVAVEHVSEEEMQEMLDVLVKDAAQVDDVVLELRGLLNDMEAKNEAILDYLSSLTSKFHEIAAAYNMIEAVSLRLPGYIIASQKFRVRWDETKLGIQDQLNNLDSMRLFYEKYHTSYDELLLEVRRREMCEDKIKAIARKATEQIDKVSQGDALRREDFRIDVGEYLPVDLWPGVNDQAPRWAFRRLDGEVGRADVPSLDGLVIESARKRMTERETIERG